MQIFKAFGLGSKRRWAWGCVAAALTTAAATGIVACGGEGAGDDEVLLATSTNPVQAAYVGWFESTTNTGVNLLTTSSTGRLAGRSTGAMRATWADGAVGECGVTFISHRYAVTAAHCIASKYLLPSSVPVTVPFTVSQYNTTALNLTAAVSQASVSGTWPNYTRLTTIGPAQGYYETNYDGCVIARRCSTAYGDKINCPFTADADIGLIYCPSRPRTGSNWVHVASSDSGTQNIDVWWFHEILALSTARTPYEMPYEPDFNYLHYYNFDDTSGRLNNYHYKHNQLHQFFPLISKHSKLNVQYKATGIGSITTNTTAAGCHGTSGSGVFIAGTDSFLGPTSTGSSAWASTQLCSNMDTGATSGLQYTNRAFTATFETLPEITGDRQ